MQYYHYYAETISRSMRKIELNGYFPWPCDDIPETLGKLLTKRLRTIRTKYNWLGVGIIVCTPLGQKTNFIIEENGNNIILIPDFS